MVDTVKARDLPQTTAFDPTTDYVVVVRGAASGPTAGPYLVPGAIVAPGGGGDGGEQPPIIITGGITKVFARTGPEIVAVAGDYDADQVDFDPGASGLPATNVQGAIDALAATPGDLPVPNAEGDHLVANGEGGWESQPPLLVSVFGRDGAVEPMAGDFHADQIADTTDGTTPTTNRFVTASDVAKLAALDPDRQPPAGGTTGQVLKKDSNADYDMSWQDDENDGGVGGSLSQIDLGPLVRPDSSAPPNWSYVSGTGVWEFSSSTTQALFCEIDYWPGGTVTLEMTVGAGVTTGNVGFSCQIAAVTPNTADLFDKALATANTGSVAVADATKKTKRLSISLTNLDSAAAGDLVRIKIARDNTVGSNAAGLANVRGMTLVFS